MNKNNKFTIAEYVEKIKLIYPNWSFDVIEFNGYKNSSIIKCNNCGKCLNFCPQLINIPNELKKVHELFGENFNLF